MSDGATLTLEQSHQLIEETLIACKTDPANAISVARALVAAEADGQKGHGFSRVPSYCAQTLSGKVDGFAKPIAEKTTPAMLRVDAGLGFAYPALDLAMETLPGMAREMGIASAVLRRSHHFGQAGAHCERLAEAGLVALVFGNAPKAVAPWGGKNALFGTNPIAFGAPAGEGKPPLVIDLAVSRIARGKIMAADKAGQKTIPEGWALDKEGNPTTDTKAALEGTMVPIGEAKGAALAMMVEVMAAAVVGANIAFEASSLFSGEGEAPNLGQLIIAIDPGLASGGAYPERMATLVGAIEAEEGARLPGMRRLANREAARKDGLFVPKAIHGEILALRDKGSIG